MRVRSRVRVAADLITIILVGCVLTSSGQSEDVSSLRAKAQAALAPISGELALDGLEADVEVIRDRWGVPHIYASTLEDLFFAQGFVAAQDRLWQLELWRRSAEGTLADILGPTAIDRDVFARLLRYRGDMEAEWQSYAPDTRRIVGAFVRGINAQVAWVVAHPDKLPLEFQLTKTTPQPWTPETVISRMAGYIMTRNARSEVQRARLAQALGFGRVAEFMPPDPPVPVTVPEGLDLADITPEILKLAETADDPFDFGASAPSGGAGGDDGIAAAVPWGRARAIPLRPPAPALAGSSAWTAGRDLLDLQDEYSTIGSNNWVVSGALTASGRPLLANDPHRPLPLPSLRYTVHLNGPGWNVIGAGEPALPGVAAGHNDRVAFGFTIVGIDQQDLVVERLNPDNTNEYQYRGQWEPMRSEMQRVSVKGREPVDVTLRFTRHGPVVHMDAQRRRAYALRWVGMEPGTAGYLASLSLNIARTWEEFLGAAGRWKVPSENLVYADVDGNIGWVAAGLAPIRPNWYGLLPVPGHEGKYEWSGFLSVKDLPQSFNPASGLVATANHNILPAGYTRSLGYEWSAPHRYQRVMEVLSARAPSATTTGRAGGNPQGFTRSDFEALQHDDVSLPARAIVEALRVASASAPPASADVAFAIKMLTTWDGRLSRDSAPAALYGLWLPYLQQAFAQAVIHPDDAPYVPERLTLEQILSILRAPTPRQLAVLTGTSLEKAWADAKSRMGADPGMWAWGRLHHARFDHPLATTPARAEIMNLPPVPRGGDGTTVFATGAALRQTSGASFREVIDVGNWDASSTINVPGLSGQPASPHYADLLPLWAAGQYHPMAFSREAVEKHAAARLKLRPAGSVPATAATSAASVPEPPDLPPFAGTVLNFDRRGDRVAACARDPDGGERQIGARRVPNTHVWVVEEEVIRQLGTTPGACDPAWSPDGSRLAVTQPNGLWTYSPTLGDPRQIADTHLPPEPRHESDYTAFAGPRWSPDARYIAVQVTNGASTWVEVFASENGRRAHKSDPGVRRYQWDSAGSTLILDGTRIAIRP